MRNHFYIVRGYKSGAESSNSTMGALWHPIIPYAPLQSNIFWFSVPYNSIYNKASDIANELGPSKVRVIAKWNPVRQQSILYYYLQGQWRGQNFPIIPGDGLWVAVASSFDWAINGTDKSIQPLVFTYRPPPMTNYYWLGLPYTGKIGTAADLVISIAGGLGPGTDTKIIEVGKWDYSKQTSDIFRYGPTGWSGVNFVIGPGDGIWILVVSTFSWQPELITPEVP